MSAVVGGQAVVGHCRAVWCNQGVVTTQATAIDETNASVEAILNQLKIQITLKCGQHSTLKAFITWYRQNCQWVV